VVFLLTWFLHWDHLSLVVTYWQPQYFLIFSIPSFIFSNKSCTTEFWAGFWWRWFCGIYGSSLVSPLQPPSLPCLSFSQSTVWYRRSAFSGRNTIFSAAIFFSVWVETFATLARCFLVTWGWVRVVGLFFWRVINPFQCTWLSWSIHRSPDGVPQRIPKDWRGIWEIFIDLGGWLLLRTRFPLPIII